MLKLLKITVVICLTMLLFTTCTDFFSFTKSKEVTISNPYNQPVSIKILSSDGDKVFDIPAYSQETVMLKTSLSEVTIYATGKYFEFYSESVPCDGAYCVVSLKANQGWVGIGNSSSYYIEPSGFYYDGNFNHVGIQNLAPGEDAFAPINKTI